MQMLETVAAYIEQHQLLPEEGSLIVAVSGGADSLCLLHLLQRLCGPGKRYPDVQLQVAHLNHQLRGQASDQDASDVAQLVGAWGLPITVGSIDVPALSRQEQRSLEDAARTARYRFLRKVARGGPIAVAHHLDDQVETLLLHWLRGGGLASMVGLQPRQRDIIRPLLAVTHADTVAYCQRHHLIPLEDESNNDTRFLRNRIRHELLPMLASINPAIRETLLRNAEVMRIDAEWIEQQVDAAWPTIVSEEQASGIQLRRDELLALPLSLQRHLVRRVTARLSTGQSPLELRHFKLIEALLHHENYYEEQTLHLPQQVHIICQGSKVIFKRVSESEGAGGQERGEGLMGGKDQEGEKDQMGGGDAHDESAEVLVNRPLCGVVVPGTGWMARAEVVEGEVLEGGVEALRRGDWEEVWRILSPTRYVVYVDGALIGDALSVRTRRPGDRIRLLGMAHEKKVQDVLVDRHIAREERDRIPLFFAQEQCVWLAGVQIDDRVRLSSATQKIVRLSISPASARDDIKSG